MFKRALNRCLLSIHQRTLNCVKYGTTSMSLFIALDSIWHVTDDDRLDDISSTSFRWLPPRTSDLDRVYTVDEVAQHNCMESGVWVTYRDSVYDVTDFIKEHPGGSQYLLDAAGGPVDEYWAHWSVHLFSKKVRLALEQYRIGRFSDYMEPTEDLIDATYADEPDREYEKHRYFSLRPYEAETQPRALWSDGMFTSSGAFYVRNHAPVPLRYAKVDSVGEHGIEFCIDRQCNMTTIGELQSKLPTRNITSVLQCAGNRAHEMSLQNGGKPTAFTGGTAETIQYGLIGNAQWSGVSLAQALRAYLPNAIVGDVSKMHVQFEGCDGYVTSVPLSHVLDERNDVLLATHMNKKPLLPDHGWPVRVLLPGIAGARNVKWLRRVDVLENESEAPWTTNFYKQSNKLSITKLPMQSLFFKPMQNERVQHSEEVQLEGIAWGGGSGTKIKRVCVSNDGGMTWKDATLLESEIPMDDSSRRWSWVRWQLKTTFNTKGKHNLVVKAVDNDGNEQPQNVFNPNGYLYNGWHEIGVNVV